MSNFAQLVPQYDAQGKAQFVAPYWDPSAVSGGTKLKVFKGSAWVQGRLKRFRNGAFEPCHVKRLVAGQWQSVH